MINLTKRIITSFMLFLLLYFSLKNSIILFITIFLLNFIAISEFNLILNKIFQNKNFYNYLSTLFIMFYMAFFSILVWTHLFPVKSLSLISFILILLVCISTDIGGYTFGKIIGGKTFSKISPKKTYSGILGSFVFALISAYIFNIFFGNIVKFKIDFLIIILLISFVSQMGDLLISFLKRKANIKDTGSILPGHGGILDRIDGILFALPLGIILVYI